MLTKHLSLLFAVLLLLGPSARIARAGQQLGRQTATAEQIKAKVAKLGVGEKAKATIRHKDGTKTKGYIARSGDDDFVIRDRKTGAATTIRYADVEWVERALPQKSAFGLIYEANAVSAPKVHS